MLKIPWSAWTTPSLIISSLFSEEGFIVKSPSQHTDEHSRAIEAVHIWNIRSRKEQTSYCMYERRTQLAHSRKWLIASRKTNQFELMRPKLKRSYRRRSMALSRRRFNLATRPLNPVSVIRSKLQYFRLQNPTDSELCSQNTTEKFSCRRRILWSAVFLRERLPTQQFKALSFKARGVIFKSRDL